jgi:glucosamine--fructose-6-phosphate aminotransferase (isomerizing)
MCGMFGYVGKREAPQIVLAGLKQLEYRGYDSWGIATYERGQRRLQVDKRVGAIGQATTRLSGTTCALGHTRWATHGGITESNAHPHVDCRSELAVIHNGIVENYAELKRELTAGGHTFRSETDTEVISHLLEDELAITPDTDDRMVLALMRVFRRLEGLSAVSVLDPARDVIAVAKNGSPLVVGSGADGSYVASDSSALLDHTRRLTFLEDGQAASLTGSQVAVYDIATGRRVSDVRVWDITWQQERSDRAGYPDYLTKETNEQPMLLRKLASTRRDDAHRLAELINDARNVYLVGCGSAMHAALTGQYLLSRIAAKSVGAVAASEFSAVADGLDEHSLVIGLSQSGETIDVLDAMKIARGRGARLAALVNVEGSSLFRMVDRPVLLGAGPERCVLATKSFTSKLGLLLLAAYASRDQFDTGSNWLTRAANEAQAFLSDEHRLDIVRSLAQRIVGAEHLYVIGRGPSYPLALEAALKIKEVSYLHAEGFAGGELKHGVIALIEEGTPCLVLAPRDDNFRSIVSGAEEVKARGGFIIGVSPNPSDVWDMHIPVADVGEASVLINALPPQVLAHELAVLRGLDPDKPRNLAKSVTVR